MSTSSPVVSFKDVDIVFGENPQSALPLIDAGKSRQDIQAETGQILGVAGATFDIHEGEVIVLMGLSGSGKSTLLRAVNGLNPVIRGEVQVHDGTQYVNPETCPPAALRQLRRRRIGMVFQQFGLLPWRTVSENVGFGLELAGVSQKDRAAKVEQQLKLVGLAGWGEKYVHELSGGMQQRVGLARAFATDAPLLLMDEPFSALDPLIRDKLQDELLDLQKELNRTIIFVSHDLDEAAKIGSRIAIMEGGRVIQLGTPQEIVRKPATDYVADFVSHMNPLNVLRARDIMAPPGSLSGSLAGGLTCDAATPIREVARLKQSSKDPVVVQRDGAIIGVIGENELLECML
ncbi:choline ABC transporter ATP-binding protein [Roseibium denhamense]|uniref:Glycine betaine/proline transport system ATP-binding protein n=1 Tax=Roseibium denhamense TaxID=76305 RepID=A0ABY1P1D0_9HYPH|nr:choline ABC transporter ATP-binding protein [Roseibium denhamense]MTI07558.1 choline ABC transporter ATP-binding protein [Roseibium denhamense]SMP23866.1 glycine betaine/proline transport system ATP-binding protein [Roseibium denhamense]